MDYVNTKMGLALTLRKQMSEQTFEEEYDGSVIKYMNHMLWGDKDMHIKHREILKQLIDNTPDD